MNWFQSLMRVCTFRVIRSLVGHKMGEKETSVEDKEKDMREFFDKLLPRLD